MMTRSNAGADELYILNCVRIAENATVSAHGRHWTSGNRIEHVKSRARRDGTMNEAVIDKVQTLCREGNRESVLTVFQNYPEHFSCIPLNDSNVESKQAINDLLRENVSNTCGGLHFAPCTVY